MTENQVKLIYEPEGFEVEAGDVIEPNPFEVRSGFEVDYVDYKNRFARIREFGHRVAWKRDEQELRESYKLVFVSVNTNTNNRNEVI